MSKTYYPPDVGCNWWRDIPGYNGKYQADRLGNLRRTYKNGKVRDLTPYKKTSKQGKKISRNRLFVHLTDADGNTKEIAVLKIMVETWLGVPPEGMVAYHKSGIVSDNRIDNIDFISRKELGHMTGGQTRRTKAVEKVDAAGNVIEVYKSAREAARLNYMSYQTVLNRCHGNIKSEYALDGYTYKFED